MRDDIFDAIKNPSNWVMVESLGYITYVCKPKIGYKCIDKTWNRVIETTEEYPYLVTDSMGGFDVITERFLYRHFNFAEPPTSEERAELFKDRGLSIYHEDKEEERDYVDEDFNDTGYIEEINDVTISKRLVHKYLDWTAIKRNKEPMWAFYINARKYTDTSRDLKIIFRDIEYILNPSGKTPRFHYDFLICEDNYSHPDLSYIIPVKNNVYMTTFEYGEFPEAELVEPIVLKRPHSIFTIEKNKEMFVSEEAEHKAERDKGLIEVADSLDTFLLIYTLLSLKYCFNRPEAEAVTPMVFSKLNLKPGGIVVGDEGGDVVCLARVLLTVQIEKNTRTNLKDEILFNAGITKDYKLRIILHYLMSTGARKKFAIKEKSAALIEFLKFIENNKEEAKRAAEAALKRFNRHDILYYEELNELVSVYPEIMDETIKNNNSRIEFLFFNTIDILSKKIERKGSSGWRIF